MFFDFFKNFGKNGRNNGRKIEDVKHGYSKPKKGFEYEDLLSRPKKNLKRRNSLTKIYIQDPADSTNILVAEEIGYMYGDVKSKFAKKKETRGVQTVPVKDFKSLGLVNTKKPNKISKYARQKGKKVKGGKNLTIKEDIRTLSFKEGPCEKGDVIIYPRKNVPKVKNKSVSFFEDKTGVRSVSSTVSGNVYDQGFIPGRIIPAIGSQTSVKIDPYSNNGQNVGYKIPRRGAPPLNGKNLSKNYSDRNEIMHNRYLPPIKPYRALGPARSMFQRVQQASSQPNLSQAFGKPQFPQPGSYPGTPLRTFDNPVSADSKPPSRGKQGWNKVREITRKNRADTILNMPLPNATGSQSNMPALPGLGANSAVPTALLRSFIRNASDTPLENRAPPRQTLKAVALPKNLTEPNSLLRGALPILPTPLAVLCLALNIFIPGIGTMMSGWMGVVWGRIRIGQGGAEERRYTAVLITVMTGLVQLFTVTFCLVGWFWAISWGLILVSVSRRYNQYILENRSSITRAAGLEMLNVSTK